jgi:hypothetical protein
LLPAQVFNVFVGMFIDPNVAPRPAEPQQWIVLDVVEGNDCAAWLDTGLIPFEQLPVPLGNLCLLRYCFGGNSWLRAIRMKVVAKTV